MCKNTTFKNKYIFEHILLKLVLKIAQIKKMNDELTKYLNDNNLESIKQIKGIASQMKTGNPAMFERVQFMRYFSDKKDIL